MKLVVIVITLVLLVGCINSNTNKNPNEAKQPTITGLWKVKFICETDFSLNENDTLRGPFCDTLKNHFIKFSNDSIYYSENNIINATYKYSKLNDTVFNVQNTSSAKTMKMYIQNLTSSNLKFINIRLDTVRLEKYEMILDCISTENNK